MLILLFSSCRICFPGKARRIESVFHENTPDTAACRTLCTVPYVCHILPERKVTVAPGDTVLRWAQWCWVNGCTQWSQKSFLSLTIPRFYNAVRNAPWWIPDSEHKVWICSLRIRSPTQAWTTTFWHSGERKMWTSNPPGWEGPRNKASYFLDSSAN